MCEAFDADTAVVFFLLRALWHHKEAGWEHNVKKVQLLPSSPRVGAYLLWLLILTSQLYWCKFFFFFPPPPLPFLILSVSLFNLQMKLNFLELKKKKKKTNTETFIFLLSSFSSRICSFRQKRSRFSVTALKAESSHTHKHTNFVFTSGLQHVLFFSDFFLSSLLINKSKGN